MSLARPHRPVALSSATAKLALALVTTVLGCRPTSAEGVAAKELNCPRRDVHYDSPMREIPAARGHRIYTMIGCGSYVEVDCEMVSSGGSLFDPKAHATGETPGRCEPRRTTPW